jgi:hypothetical protein
MSTVIQDALDRTVFRFVPCRGDGSDETAIINAATAAASAGGGGTVFLPSNKTIRAVGVKLYPGVTLHVPRTCILKLTDAATTSLIVNCDAAGVVGNPTTDIAIMGGGTLDGNQAGVAQTAPTEGLAAIGLQQVTRFRIEDLYIHDTRQSAINMQGGCSQGTVDRVLMNVCGNDNLLVLSNYDAAKVNNGLCQDIRVSNCLSMNAGGVATPLSGGPVRTGYEVSNDSRNIAFSNCIAVACADAGFLVNNHPATGGPYAVSYSGCHARDCGAASGGATGLGAGFYALAQDAQGPDGITYSGCTAAGGAYGWRIEENTLTATSQIGNVLCTGCYAGGYLTNSSGTVGTADAPTTAGFSLSYKVAAPSATKAVTFAGCTAEGISAGNGFTLQSLVAATIRTTVLTGCVARGITGSGFSLSNLCDVQMSSCTADGCSAIGITVIAGNDRTLLTGCVVRNAPSGINAFSVGANHCSFVNCYADNGAAAGFNVSSTATATAFTGCVARACQNGFVDNGIQSSFSGCRAIGTTGTSGAGFLVQGATAGHTFVGCVGQDATTSSVGFKVSGGTDITFDGCVATGNNGAGLFIASASAVRILVTNCRLTNNATYGIRFGTLPATAAAIAVLGCILTGNTTAAAQYTSIPTDGSLLVRDCQGINPAGAFANQPAVPSSTAAYTYACDTAGHAPLGLPPATVYITGGTVTVIAIAGQATGLTAGSFRVLPGQTVTLTYSVAPTWTWLGE